jgi:hypothetical protein
MSVFFGTACMLNRMDALWYPLCQAPVQIEPGTALRDITATRVSDTLLVTCYRLAFNATSSGFCRAGIVNSGGIIFGNAFLVPESTEYIEGALSNLDVATDRVVLAFSAGFNLTAPASRIAILGISGTTLTALSSPLDKYEVSAAADYNSLVSLTNTTLLLAYRVRGLRQALLMTALES